MLLLTIDDAVQYQYMSFSNRRVEISSSARHALIVIAAVVLSKGVMIDTAIEDWFEQET